MVKQYRKEKNRINKTEEILIKITFLFLFKIFNFFIYLSKLFSVFIEQTTCLENIYLKNNYYIKKEELYYNFFFQ